MFEQREDLRVVRFLGLARSGNHAIIDWVLAQAAEQWLFLNCVAPGADPFVGARPTDEGETWRSNCSDPPSSILQAQVLGETGSLYFSQEDCFLRSAWGDEATRVQEEAIERRTGRRIGQRLDVLILRDPYNLFASRRRFRHPLLAEPAALRIWKQHAKAFLGLRTCLRRPILAISYNRWCNEPFYRRRLTQQLGLHFTDAQVDAVPSVGGGSSFDGQGYHGRASQMAVHQRWRHYEGDSSFRSLFDDNVRKLAGRIFGPPPWEEMASLHRHPADTEAVHPAPML